MSCRPRHSPMYGQLVQRFCGKRIPPVRQKLSRLDPVLSSFDADQIKPIWKFA